MKRTISCPRAHNSSLRAQTYQYSSLRAHNSSLRAQAYQYSSLRAHNENSCLRAHNSSLRARILSLLITFGILTLCSAATQRSSMAKDVKMAWGTNPLPPLQLNGNEILSDAVDRWRKPAAQALQAATKGEWVMNIIQSLEGDINSGVTLSSHDLSAR